MSDFYERLPESALEWVRNVIKSAEEIGVDHKSLAALADLFWQHFDYAAKYPDFNPKDFEYRIDYLLNGNVKKVWPAEMDLYSLVYSVEFYRRTLLEEECREADDIEIQIASCILDGKLCRVGFWGNGTNLTTFDSDKENSGFYFNHMHNRNTEKFERATDEYNREIEREYGFTITGICIDIGGRRIFYDNKGTHAFPFLLYKDSFIGSYQDCEKHLYEHFKVSPLRHEGVWPSDELDIRVCLSKGGVIPFFYFSLKVDGASWDSSYTVYFVTEKADGSKRLVPVADLREWERTRQATLDAMRKQNMAYANAIMLPLADKEEP